MSIGVHPRFSAYKSSGNLLLGEVPTTWQVARVAHAFVKSNAGEVIDKSYWGDGAELLYTCNRTPMQSDFSVFPAWKRTVKNDLLLTRNGTPYVHKPLAGAIYSNVVQRITLAKEFSRDYLSYCLGNSALGMRGYGVSIESFNFDNWKSLRFAHPSLEEQTQIAKFLDYETARIDALIEKQQQLIALLKEKRQAVISHAVTKGLHPDAPMRDSGVEWLGEVPAHWQILPVRHALRIDNGPRLPINRLERAEMAGPFPYWGPTGILDHIDQYRYEGDRAIIGEDGDHFLKFAIWPMTQWVTGKFNVNNHAHVIADGRKCSARWFYYSFLHRDIGGDVIAQGVSRLKLSREGLSKLVLAVPPLKEQEALMAQMAPVLVKVEKATVASEQQIELLQERRTALISAAVTGKIDVRGWQPPETTAEAA